MLLVYSLRSKACDRKVLGAAAAAAVAVEAMMPANERHLAAAGTSRRNHVRRELQGSSLPLKLEQCAGSTDGEGCWCGNQDLLRRVPVAIDPRALLKATVGDVLHDSSNANSLQFIMVA